MVVVPSVSAPPLVRLTDPKVVVAAEVSKLALPPTVKAPDWLIRPLATTFNVPETVEVPRSRAVASVRVTSLPLFTATVLKLLPGESSVMSLVVPVDRVVTPVTLSAPL